MLATKPPRGAEETCHEDHRPGRRHHCVHHASNDACLDKNFGSMLILYDRLFGTFAEAPAGEQLRFGLKNSGVPSHNPFAIVAAGWRDIARGLRGATTWHTRVAAVFGRP